MKQVIERPPAGFEFEAKRDILISNDQILEFFGRALSADALAIDVESNGNKWWNFTRYDIAGYSITIPGRNIFVPLNMTRYSPEQQNSNFALSQIMLNKLVASNVTIIGANQKFDWHVFWRCMGVDFPNKVKKICDVLLGLHLLEPNAEHGVKTYGEQLIGPEARYYENRLHQTLQAMGIRKKDEDYYDYRQAPLGILAPYAACDTWLTWIVYRYLLSHRALQPNIPYLQTEHKVARYLFTPEETGIKVDKEFLGKFQEELEENIPLYQAKAFRSVGKVFNLDSDDQVKQVLYEDLGLPEQFKTVKKKNSDGSITREKRLTTDKSALFALQGQHPVIEWMQKYRAETKIQTYTNALANNLDTGGRIHTTFNQFKEDEAKLNTGRLSSSHPINFENIPAHDTRIRRCFIPDNEFVLIDYSGQEVRIYTHYSQEPTLVNAYHTGEDVHSRTTEAVFNIPYAEVNAKRKTDKAMYDMRDFSKKFLFGDFYGSGLERKAEQMAAAGYGYSVERARTLKANLLKNYPGIKQTMRALEQHYRQYGYVVDIFGRRYVPRGEDLLYTLLNYLIQGTGAGILKHAFVAICENFGPKIFANLIHDELVYDRLPSRRDVLRIKELSEDFPMLSIPMVVEVSYARESWQNKLEVEKYFNQWIDGAELEEKEGAIQLAA